VLAHCLTGEPLQQQQLLLMTLVQMTGLENA